MRRLLAYGAGAMALSALIVLFGQLSTQINKFATATALEEVKITLIGGQKENTASILIMQLQANQGNMYRNRAEQDRLRRSNQVDKNLQREEIFLNNERDRLQRLLRKLEE